MGAKQGSCNRDSGQGAEFEAFLQEDRKGRDFLELLEKSSWKNQAKG